MELRKDYVLNRWVFIAPERKKRSKEFVKKIETCFFCPGNENLTPAEIGRVEENNKWKIRYFKNKFPIVDKEKNIKEENEFFTWSSAYGEHEVIVECREHDKQLWDLPTDHIKQILEVYKNRINELSKDNKYVLVFKNHGFEAGTSLVHTHTQVVALNKIPQLVVDEVNANKECNYCKIIKIEEESKRKCFSNKNFIAFAPYASRFNFEV